MRIELHLHRSALRRWHLDLVSALERRPGHVVAVRWVDVAVPEPCEEIESFLAFERALHRRRTGGSLPEEPESLGRCAGADPSDPDLVIDLSGAGRTVGVATWMVTFDGTVGEEAAAACLLEGRMPVVAVVDAHSGLSVSEGRPGSEHRNILVHALDDVLAGTVTLVLAALDGAATQGLTKAVKGQGAGHLDLRRRKVETIARFAAVRAYHLLYRSPHWRVGWRFVDGPDVMDLLRHPAEGWFDLPDDGYHFYADPFPVVDRGATHLFVEDFDHRVGRGVISVVTFGDRGPEGRPSAVLEHRVHLSYPCVLFDEGTWWMIPETSAASTVELYRARSFPHGWELSDVLLDGVEASDATVFRHDGRWWMTATVRAGGSSSDSLHVWSAARLRGPWVGHERNPVLVDVSAARPAGRVVNRHGRLLRPAQNGTDGYGASLVIAEITRLDQEGYAQRVVGQLGPGSKWPGRALHTLNRAGRLECIDGSALSPRWRRRPQGVS
jgi:hypothetical protein